MSASISRFGVRDPGRPKKASPWFVQFIDAMTELSDKVRIRYEQQSTSAQITGTDDEYATKLQSQWRSGGARGSRANPITEMDQVPPDAGPYPHQPGKVAPSDRRFGMDARPSTQVNGRRPMYRPRPEPYALYAGTYQPGNYRRDYLPLRIDDRLPPVRTVRPHRDGLALMAGIAQFGTRQTYGQGETSIAIAPVNVLPAMRGRGVLGMRGGIFGRGAQGQGTGLEAIPAVFTPTSVS